jgi:hypothetical protein
LTDLSFYDPLNDGQWASRVPGSTMVMRLSAMEIEKQSNGKISM